MILYTNADTLTNKLNELNTLIESLQLSNNQQRECGKYRLPSTYGQKWPFSFAIYASLHADNTDPVPKLNLNKGNYSELRKFLDINWDSLLQPYVNNVEMMWNAINL